MNLIPPGQCTRFRIGHCIFCAVLSLSTRPTVFSIFSPALRKHIGARNISQMKMSLLLWKRYRKPKTELTLKCRLTSAASAVNANLVRKGLKKYEFARVLKHVRHNPATNVSKTEFKSDFTRSLYMASMQRVAVDS